VVEPGGGLGLAQQARAALGAEDSARQHLERHIPIEQRVVRAIDHAHATLPDLGVKTVAIVHQRADHPSPPAPLYSTLVAKARRKSLGQGCPVGNI
jgi:hypothetical protein